MNLSGNPIDYLIVFLGGILLSFTPCVYPLIPISASFISIRSEGSKIKGLTLSLTYTTAVALAYSLLGLLASLTGKVFGAISLNPLIRICVGLIIVAFGLSMLDLFNIPQSRILRLPKLKKSGYLSTFFLGLSSGLMISPCTTPVLGAILVYLATKKNIIYGTTLLFTFAYGLGLIFIIVGTFSSILVNLPKSGRWMVYIKKFAAAILICLGIYFIIIAIKGF